MTNTQKTKQELQNEKIANDDLLEVSSNNIHENKKKIEKTYKHIITEQQTLSNSISVDKRLQMNSTLLDSHKSIQDFTSEKDKLDVQDDKSEKTETRLDRSIISTLIESTKKREDILGPKANELGPIYRELVDKINSLDEENKHLVDNHLKLVDKNIEIKEQIDRKDSLINDYADTSVEMPSYMDSED